MLPLLGSLIGPEREKSSGFTVLGLDDALRGSVAIERRTDDSVRQYNSIRQWLWASASSWGWKTMVVVSSPLKVVTQGLPPSAWCLGTTPSLSGP
eukprot:1659578-Amphidinium_carterae.1